MHERPILSSSLQSGLRGERAMKTLVLLVSMAGLPTVALGQAAIAGSVTDSSGASMAGVTVEASSPALIEKSVPRSPMAPADTASRISDLASMPSRSRSRLEPVPARRRRADGVVHRDGQRGARGRTAGRDDHRHREVPVVDVHSAKREVTLSGDVVQVDSHRSQLQRAARARARRCHQRATISSPAPRPPRFPIHGGRTERGPARCSTA